MTYKSSIYLDFNATTPLDPVVLEAMIPYFTENFGNASSQTHQAGRICAAKVEDARALIAEAIGAEPNELIFTSGSTESINIALTGIYQAYKSKGNHIITWQTEHNAVLETLNNLESLGAEITRLPVFRDGMPDISFLRSSIRNDTILVVCMTANNETGVLNPIEEIADITHSKNAILFSDATQSIGKVKFDVNDCGVDAVSISAHKFYGPKGVGALYLRRKKPRVKIKPLTYGGGQENGLRPGTLNVAGIIGMAKAIELAVDNLWDQSANQSRLRTLLEQGLEQNSGIHINGNIRNRLPNTSNILFSGVKNEKLIMAVPQIQFAVGSACTSVLPRPSHVLRSMGLDELSCNSSVRFSLGKTTTQKEIMSIIEILNAAVNSLRE